MSDYPYAFRFAFVGGTGPLPDDLNLSSHPITLGSADEVMMAVIANAAYIIAQTELGGDWNETTKTRYWELVKRFNAG